MNQILFTARVTGDVPPKLSVGFGKDSPFTRRNAPCEEITVGGDKQCKINLGTKTVDVEAINTLASGGDYGKSLTLRQVSQNSYACDDEDEVSTTLGNVAQVVLQIRNASLVAEFSKGGAGPVAPMMPGALPAAQAAAPSTTTSANPWGDGWGAALIATTQQPAVTPIINTIPIQDKLIFCLPDSELPVTPLTLVYKGLRNSADRNLVSTLSPQDYQYLLRKERNYLALQEKLKAAAAHNKLTGCLSKDEAENAMRGFPGSSERDIHAAFIDYQWYVNNPHCPSGFRADYATQYPIFLQAERNHLAQQARNEYNAAN